MGKSLEDRRLQLLDLRERFRQLTGHYQIEADEIANSTESVEDTSPGNASNEMADAATPTYDHEMALTLRNRYRYRLTAIEEALTRMDQGAYGHCAVCYAPISETRLDLIPETPFCSEHAGTAEAVDNVPNITQKDWPNPGTAA